MNRRGRRRETRRPNYRFSKFIFVSRSAWLELGLFRYGYLFLLAWPLMD